MTILVVDDQAAMRFELARVFTLAGWTARSVGTLAEARLFAEIMQPNVVLTDRRLGDEDGAALIGCGIPVVIYSGDPAWVRGASAVVLKPCQGGYGGLVKLVSASLEGAEASW